MHPIYTKPHFGLKDKAVMDMFRDYFEGKDFHSSMNGFIEECKKFPIETTKGESGNVEGDAIEFSIMSQIQQNGHVYIEADRLDWESKISEKTFENMTLDMIKLPFKAGLIGLGGEEYISFYMEGEGERPKGVDLLNKVRDEHGPEDELRRVAYITKYSRDGNPYITGFWSNDTFKDVVENAAKISDDRGEKVKSAIYTTLSLLLYIAAFRKEKELVREYEDKISRKLARRASKSTPAHTVRRIEITPNAKVIRQQGAPGKNGKKIGEGKTWLVRGHWRNQYYPASETYKLKWIEPFWKGSGKQEIEKIYSVSPGEKQKETTITSLLSEKGESLSEKQDQSIRSGL